MAITQSQKNAGIGGQLATGRYLTSSTAAAITINLGFKPRYIKVVNLTSASTGLVAMEYIEGMADASGIKTNDEGTSETGVTLVTSNGITVSDTGFTIGLDTDLNVINEQLTWVAMA